MSKDLSALTGALIDAGLKAGADAVDALAVDGASISVEVREGKLEQAEREEGVEIGIRVLVGKRQACVSASNTRPETLREMAERAVVMARLAPEDPFAGLAEPGQLSQVRDGEGLQLADTEPAPGPAELEEAARRMEATALAVEGITRIDSSGAGTSRRRIHLAASNGFSGGYERSSHWLSVVPITGDGTAMERDWASESRVFYGDLPAPEAVARLAAERTLARAGARQAKTGAYPVLYDERVSASLIGHLLGAINGASVARGSSWLRGAMGEQVLPKGLSITEDPLRPRIGSSRPFDGEGLRAEKRDWVTDGVLNGWVLDLATGRQLGMASTGNAQRGTSSPPSPGTSNIALTEGVKTRGDLIREMGTGFLVTSMIGSTINPTTGDYSRGAAGWWVENGELTYPVSGVTIAGNLRQMLKSIIPADDARPWLSALVPSLLVEGLTLAGS